VFNAFSGFKVLHILLCSFVIVNVFNYLYVFACFHGVFVLALFKCVVGFFILFLYGFNCLFTVYMCFNV